MKTIALKHGYVVLVDDEDFEELSRRKWSAFRHRGTVYARTSVKTHDGSFKRPYIHRIIMEAAPGVQVDHINGNGLDNRRSNLRVCIAQQNQMNRSATKVNRCGFKGVHWKRKPGCWAAICCKKYIKGGFKDPSEAAKAYDAYAKERFGEFARLNFT